MSAARTPCCSAPTPGTDGTTRAVAVRDAGGAVPGARHRRVGLGGERRARRAPVTRSVRCPRCERGGCTSWGSRRRSCTSTTSTRRSPARARSWCEVAAASLNFPDVLMCRGEYQVKPPLPFTPGAEVSGVVDGPRRRRRPVAARPPGDRDPEVRRRRVHRADRRAGGTVFPIPDSLDDGAAAALHVTYQTGHVALHRRAALQAGETLLVHAGAGGVGSAAIQLGIAAGAGDRDGGWPREGAGVPGPRRRPRGRLPRRRLRRRGEGVHRRARAPT